MKAIFSLAMLLWALASPPSPAHADAGLSINPVLPASCHDGLAHRRLNAVSSVTVGENETQVLLAFRAYMVDCHTEAGKVVWHYYGPLHRGRCDLSVRGYSGVRMRSVIGPLGAPPPYEQTEVCAVGVSFEKSALKAAGDNDFLYVYRYDGLGEYQWNINIRLDEASGKFLPVITAVIPGRTPR